MLLLGAQVGPGCQAAIHPPGRGGACVSENSWDNYRAVNSWRSRGNKGKLSCARSCISIVALSVAFLLTEKRERKRKAQPCCVKEVGRLLSIEHIFCLLHWLHFTKQNITLIFRRGNTAYSTVLLGAIISTHVINIIPHTCPMM